MSTYAHSPSSPTPQPLRAALVVAHPGHELRVYGWLETAMPRVCVLTDGSGRTRRSRLGSTAQVLAAAGASAGPVYGSLSDQDLYAAVLDRNYTVFTRIADELASMLLREQIECIAGDAAEGYNPAHDICRLIINSAVKLAYRVGQKQIANYDFPLVGPPDQCPEVLGAPAIRIELDKDAFARKLAAARSYPELQAEVTAALSGAGSVGIKQHPDIARDVGLDNRGTSANDFQIECLRPVNCDSQSVSAMCSERPFYEAYGEKQVLAGHYTRVLRCREHILPLVAALDAHIERLS